MLDALAFEPQFLDHVAPVWQALPEGLRGMLYVDESLAARAIAKGLDFETIDAGARRVSSPPPKAAPGDGPVALTASIGDIKIGRRMGYRKFIFQEHGCGQAYLGDRGIRHPSYAGGADREDVALFLMPNEYSANLWRQAYPALVEVVGSPRLDLLPRKAVPGHVVAISFHWPAFASQEAGTAMGHYFHSLKELAQRFEMIGHCHPKGDWPAEMERVYRRAGIEFVPDFDEVCRRADVYVCDNSSTMFEFAATGRQVVVLNHPQYRRNVSHGGRFWDWAPVGVQVDGPAELPAAIERALEDRQADRDSRDAVLRLVFAYPSGAAKRAADAIVNWMRSEVAA
jgi:hypothetical protein